MKTKNFEEAGRGQATVGVTPNKRRRFFAEAPHVFANLSPRLRRESWAEGPRMPDVFTVATGWKMKREPRLHLRCGQSV